MRRPSALVVKPTVSEQFSAERFSTEQGQDWLGGAARGLDFSSSDMSFRLIHFINRKKLVVISHNQIKGRLRMKVRGLYRSPAIKSALHASLPTMPFVVHVEISELTGSVLLFYDPKGSEQSLVDSVEFLVRKLLYERLTRHSTSFPYPDGLQDREQLLQPWHTMPADEVLARCSSDTTQGLSQAQAEERMHINGRNLFVSLPEQPAWRLFARQFATLPVAVLTGSALLALATGAPAEAGLILSVVAVNGVIGFVTESRAEKAIRSLDTRDNPLIKVIRDGKGREVYADQLVIGDIMLLSMGEVPADARILKTEGLRVDESALTGESKPIKKHSAALVAKVPVGLHGRTNMLFKGTLITVGSTTAVVTGTGSLTELGKIRSLTQNRSNGVTALQKNLSKLGDDMVLLSAVVCGGVFCVGLMRGLGFGPMFKTAVSLAIAAVPEGLPAVGTTTLAFGVKNLRKKNILARNLHGVEALGTIQVFCLDKTGTLTLNQMQVEHVVLPKQKIHLATPTLEESFFSGDKPLSYDLQKFIEICALCNDTRIRQTASGLRLSGSPTEKALMSLAFLASKDPLAIIERNRRVGSSYRSETQHYMVTTHELVGGQTWQAMKGNPKQVLELCRYKLVNRQVKPLEESDRSEILLENAALGQNSLRVLGIAYRENLDEDAPFIWVGLVGMADPIRGGIKELIEHFHRAGIETIMLTGDQSETARAIGRKLALSGTKELVVAPDNWMDELQIDSDEFRDNKRIHIFPRVSPENKLKIVEFLQQHGGRIVSMTGDGINDAPALKAANIGISLGRCGTSAAKECADIVIADDDLGKIYFAIAQGRTIRKNLQKSIQFLLSTNISEILLMLGGVAFGLGSPLNSMQLLWINLLTDIFPSLALAMEKSDYAIMQEDPLDPQRPLFIQQEKNAIMKDSVLMSGASFGVYAAFVRKYGVGSAANTGAFLSLTGAQLMHAYSVQRQDRFSLTQHKKRQNMRLHASVLVGLAALVGGVYLPGLRTLLGNTPLKGRDSLTACVGAIAPFLINETRHSIKRRQEVGRELS